MDPKSMEDSEKQKRGVLEIMGLMQNRNGAISIFLAILVSVCLLVAQIMVDASRARGATTYIKGAMELSAQGTLTNYNQMLKEMYGLLALAEDDPEKLRDEFEYYLLRNLNVRGLEEKLTPMDLAIQRVREGFSIEEKTPHRFHDFELDHLNIMPMYSLAEPEVLRDQILEYMKYRAPKQLNSGVIEKFTAFGGIKKQTDMLNKKLEIDEGLSKIRKEQENASKNIYAINAFGAGFSFESMYEDVANEILEKCALQTDMQKENEALEMAQAHMKDVLKMPTNEGETHPLLDGTLLEINRIKNRIKDLEKRIRDKETDLNYKKNQWLESIQWSWDASLSAEKSLQAVKKGAGDYKEDMDTLKQNANEENSDFSIALKNDLEAKEANIKSEEIDKHLFDIAHNKSRLERFKKILEAKPFEKVGIENFNQGMPTKEKIKEFLSQKEILGILESYKGYRNANKTETKPISYHVPSVAKREQEDTPDPRELSKEKQQKENKTEKGINKEKLSSSQEINALPPVYASEKNMVDRLRTEGMFSLADDTNQSSAQIEGIKAPSESEADFKKNMEFAKKALGFVSNMTNVLSNSLVNMRDEIYINEYLLGQFTNQASDVNEENPHYTLRGQDMKELIEQRKEGEDFKDNVFQKAEIEYILWGNSEEMDNRIATYAQLLCTRFVLNSLAIYSDPAKVKQANASAWVVAGWTSTFTGGLGVIVVQNLILLAWAFAESGLDAHMIMNQGKKDIPLFKMKGQWFLDQSMEKGMAVIKEEVLGWAEEKTNQAIDYTTDKFDQKGTQMVEQLEANCIAIIEREIDKAFHPLENTLMGLENALQQSISWDDSFFIEDQLEEGMAKEARGLLENIIAKAREHITQSLTQNPSEGYLKQFYQKMQSIQERLLDAQDVVMKETNEGLWEKRKAFDFNNDTKVFESTRAELFAESRNAIQEAKIEMRNHVLKYVQSELKDYKEYISKGASKLNALSKEQVGSFFSQLGGDEKVDAMGEDTPINGNNLRSAFLTAEYRDYLRVFLMFVNDDVKMQRTGDLIELNVWARGKRADFSLRKSNAYLRMESRVSQPYLFRALSLLPGNTRLSRVRHAYIGFQGY
jgi:hypothetical protein